MTTRQWGEGNPPMGQSYISATSLLLNINYYFLIVRAIHLHCRNRLIQY